MLKSASAALCAGRRIRGQKLAGKALGVALRFELEGGGRHGEELAVLEERVDGRPLADIGLVIGHRLRIARGLLELPKKVVLVLHRQRIIDNRHADRTDHEYCPSATRAEFYGLLSTNEF